MPLEGGDDAAGVLSAKRERTTSKRLFTMSIDALNKAISKKQSVLSINKLHTIVDQRWESVQEKHAAYLAYCITDEDETPETEIQWLTQCSDSYADVEESKDRFLLESQEHSKQDKQCVKKSKRAVKFERSSLNSRIQNLEAVAADEETPSQVVQESQNELKKQHEQYLTVQRELIIELSDEEEVEAEMKLSEQIQKLCLQANVAAGKRVKLQDQDNSKDEIRKHKGLEIKLQRMELPKFNGEPREFPRFKYEFTKFVQPALKGKDEAIYTLKSCLSKDALDHVKNIDDNLDEMWRRLEERYGRTSIITRAILSDIKQLNPVSDGDGVKFIKLVDTVEQCFRDLERINMEFEISNSTIVGEIEDKLPPTIRSMWSLAVCDETNKNESVDERNKFPHLLKFLLRHRRAIEYSSTDIKPRKQTRTTSDAVINHLNKEEIHDKKPANDETSSTNQRPGCWYHSTNKHEITDCITYTSSSVDDRWHMVLDYRACFCCLKAGHRQNSCYNLKACGINGCTEKHHSTLHREENPRKSEGSTASRAANSQGANNKEARVPENYHVKHATNEDRSIQVCLLQLMQVRAGYKGEYTVNMFYDSGSKVSMITFKKASELGLEGKKIKINIIKVGASRETIDSKQYDVPIMDCKGNIEYFKAYGIDKISTEIESNNVTEISQLFAVEPESVKRPTGEIELLVGLEYAGYHPERVKSAEHLLLMQNKFGVCLSGTHPVLQEKTQLIIQDVQIAHATVKFEEFFEHEALGVSCVPKCGSCKCGECPVGGKQYTLQQEQELALIEKGLVLHEGTWTSTYPWKKDPNILPNNYSAALAMLKSTEKRLRKNAKHAETYSQQILDMEQRGAARRLSSTEIHEYTGPIHYISHHEILKPDSNSTPCRIVFNSSAKFMNYTLNDFWVKGPDLVNNLLGILLRFRENLVAIAGDISKMYHTVRISELDQHTHRFLWRYMQENTKPNIYAMSVVSFGDKPAGAIASLALRKTATLHSSISPAAAKTITENSYVDDIVDSFDNLTVAEEITQRADEILDKGGFRIKEWTISGKEKKSGVKIIGDSPDNKDDNTQSRVLGVGWDPEMDTLQFETKINFSTRHKKIHTQPNLSKENVADEIPLQLTRRMILSQVNGIFDPLGLMAPFVVRAKIMLRKLTQDKAGWDDRIMDDDRSNWCNFFCEMFEVEDIKFPRSTKPKDAVGSPYLVMFSDASKDAIGTCAYIRWELTDGSFESRLLVAKSKLAPLKTITIPRLELNAALLAARLQKFITQHVSLKFVKTYFIVDSEIVRAMIQKESYGFNTFVGVRIGEIQATTMKQDWFWLEGTLNIADIITRGSKPHDLDEDSIWQTGPKFLKLPEEEWPLKQSFSGQQLPDQIIMSVSEVSTHSSISSAIKVSRFSQYDNLLRVTARVISTFRSHNGSSGASLKNMWQAPDRQSIEEAETRWIQEEQQLLKEQIKPSTLKRLGVTDIEGIKVVGARLENWQHFTYNHQNPPLLSAKSDFARLYAQKVHDECHLGVSAVMAKVRAKYWIVGLRSLVKSIRFKCVKCRQLDKRVQEQVMGQIPKERLKPAPAWTYVSLDLFGPFEIRGETNKRSRSKGYGVLYNCLLSRAVHVDIATDYSTDTFLLAMRRFISLRGCPTKVWSDRGTQLVAANKELREIIAGHNDNIIEEFGSQHSIDWSFSAPDGPWQNGCAESLIKSVKKALKVAIGLQVLTLSEMQTVLYESANLVNERPIGRHPESAEDGTYLSPNDLLLGRSSIKVPSGQFASSVTKQMRYRFVQRIVNAFWQKWTRDYFPSLIIRQKWHTAKRSVKVGDVVMVQDSNNVRGRWRMGRVSKAEPSLRDGFVRNIDIEYKNPNHAVFTTITRPVQRVIVIVPVEGDEE